MTLTLEPLSPAGTVSDFMRALSGACFIGFLGFLANPDNNVTPLHPFAGTVSDFMRVYNPSNAMPIVLERMDHLAPSDPRSPGWAHTKCLYRCVISHRVLDCMKNAVCLQSLCPLPTASHGCKLPLSVGHNTKDGTQTADTANTRSHTQSHTHMITQALR